MYSLFYFLFALAILVIVHEFGHFWVARRCGVKVLKFSVGFGTPLWRTKGKDGTEYIVAAIPLGGFVKMLDEREGEVAENERHKAFNRQSLRARVAIVAAGPIANILFAILAYWLIFVTGIPGIKPIVEEVAIASPADQAQLIIGDEIIAINGHKTPTWLAVHKSLLKLADTGDIAELSIVSGGTISERLLNIPKLDFSAASSTSIIQEIGITPIRIELLPIIGSISKGGAADLAGLQVGDRLVMADEQVINDWMSWVKLIRQSAQQPLKISVERSGQILQMDLTPKKSADGVGLIGAGVDASKTIIPEALQSELRYGALAAIGYAALETGQFSASTLKSLAGMLTGSVSSKNLGGPISIAQYAGQSADRGFIAFVSFLAMISISLGILNLLPIPVLDGGHLTMYFVEWLRGRPVSEQFQLQGQKVGIILLLMLMLLAFFNDLTRLFG